MLILHSELVILLLSVGFIMRELVLLEILLIVGRVVVLDGEFKFLVIMNI